MHNSKFIKGPPAVLEPAVITDKSDHLIEEMLKSPTNVKNA